MRQEFAAVGLAPQREHRAGDLGVAQAFQAQQPAPQGSVRNRLDIKDQNVHTRAASISAFMSRTAAGRPVKMARATIAWPMFNSTISRIAATGCTL